MIRYWYFNWRYEIHRRHERALIWLAWKLPRSLVMWCYIRVVTSGEDGDPSAQNVMEPLKRWEEVK